jgi:transcriptional regulator with XRE-family HTH domain
MTGDELAAAGRRLFPGGGSQKRFAAALGISYDLLRKMLNGHVEIEPDTIAAVRSLQSERAIGVPPDGLAPHLDALAAQAEAEDWTPAEVVAGVRKWLGEREPND